MLNYSQVASLPAGTKFWRRHCIMSMEAYN